MDLHKGADWKNAWDDPSDFQGCPSRQGISDTFAGIGHDLTRMAAKERKERKGWTWGVARKWPVGLRGSQPRAYCDACS